MPTLLDDLSGFQFEDLMEDVFRNLGYDNVRQSRRTGDEGRDILMEEQINGETRAVIVECKHKDKVSRPTIQKLHSAITTYDHSGPKRGILATTGRFTAPAREYTEDLNQDRSETDIELIDGNDLREIADDVGLDLMNGRIEIVCDETLRPGDPTTGVEGTVRETFQSVENLDASRVPVSSTHVDFHPFVKIDSETDAVFETSVGVIHEVHENGSFLVRADRDRPRISDDDIHDLVANNFRRTVELNESQFHEMFDGVDIRRFGMTETGYKEWAVDRLQNEYTTEVEYTGDNNVDYSKVCEPKKSDISIQSIRPVYLPQIRATTTLQGYDYPYEFYSAGPSRVTVEDGIHRCVQCGNTGDDTYTYCENCGSINCASHIKTERWEQDPVCTGCAVTERFFLRTKYFYNQQNLNEFRAQYEQMPLHEKALENKPLVAGAVLTVLLAVIGILVSVGMI